MLCKLSDLQPQFQFWECKTILGAGVFLKWANFFIPKVLPESIPALELILLLYRMNVIYLYVKMLAMIGLKILREE